MTQGAVERVLAGGLERRLFPGAAVLLAHRGQIVTRLCLGRLGYEEEDGPWGPVTPESVYDLASLTKPLVGSLLAAMLVEEGRLAWDKPIATWLEALAHAPQGSLTLRQILCHAAGYPAWRPLYEQGFDGCGLRPREDLLALALQELPEAEPAERTCYSDVGYWTLTALLESVLGERLDAAFAARVSGPLGLSRTFFVPLPRREGGLAVPLSEIAPTSRCPWRGRLLHAEVEDENASALGGVAAHAGLFSSLKDLGRLFLNLREVSRGGPGLLRPQTLAALWERQGQPAGTSWALGWDTPNRVGSHPPSGVGERFSRNAVGMWAFTGPSLWYDRERDLVVLCLTNRVHPSRDSATLKDFRPALHEAALEEIA